MTDYKKSTGSSGTMMIRDNGTTVSFLINSGNSSTFVGALPWGYTINGATNNDRETRYNAGAGWVTLGSWTVTTDQTVTFRIFDSGTSGIGGPTTLSVDIDRAKAPSIAVKPTLTAVTAGSMHVGWAIPNDGGAAIDGYQVARNTSNTTVGATIVNVVSDVTLTGLEPGTQYYVWVRAHNAKGYAGWSASSTATTLRGGDAPYQVITSNPSQTSFLASFADGPSNGGTPITARQIAYNTTNTTTGATILPYTGVMTISGLQPATTYYVWARVQNAVGYSQWSPVATIRTIAGAWMNINDVWVEVIPYVKDGGVWKLARPWTRTAGVWKETT